MRRQWIKFFFLSTGELFSIGKVDYKKIGFITAEEVKTGSTITILFWTEVRSYRPFGGRKSELQRAPVGGTPVPPQTPKPPLQPSGDRRSETIGGSELTPSS